VSVEPQTSSLGVLVHASVLEENVHDAQRVGTAQLQQETSVIICASIIVLTNYALPITHTSSFFQRVHSSLSNGSWIR